MKCVAKKTNVNSNTNSDINTNSDETLEVLLYGFCEKFYPLASIKNVKSLIEKYSKDKKTEIDLISHSNLFCNYTHPVESWVACDFKGDFERHCLEACKKLSTSGDAIELPFNTVWDGSPDKKDFMKILSGTFLMVNNTNKHISRLDAPDYTLLYESLSSARPSYVTLSYDFSAAKLDITPQSKIFVIPSIMEVDGPLNKNIYTHEERFRQTLEQVKSVRNKVKGAVIIVCELTFMTLIEIYKISKYTSALIFFNKDSTAVRYADDRNKNKAEVYLQRFVLTCLAGATFSHFCKFGGRYSLTDVFNERKFFSGKPSFRIIPKAHDGVPIVESIFYSIPRVHMSLFNTILASMQELLDNHFTDVEHLLYSLFINNHKIEVNKLETLGIAGHFAGSGAYNPS